MERIILHADLNAFFASVECLFHPELKNVPMAVAGDAEQRHGIILAKNELAKACGVKTAEPIWQAKRKCPDLLTVAPRHDEYGKYSRIVKEIYNWFTDRVESFGLDECWLDMTGCLPDPSESVNFADRLRKTVRDETGLTVSVGVSWNKVFAKLGSDLKKPDATTAITKENYHEIVWPLPANDLLFVGRATDNALRRYGVHTIGDIAASPPEFLQRVLGKLGRELWIYANGLDASPVAAAEEQREIKTVGNSITTAQDIVDIEEARKYIYLLSENVAQRLRRHEFKCRTVQITLKDKNFRVIERQGKLKLPSCTCAEIADKAMELLSQHYQFQTPLRLIGVRACDLTDPAEGEQLVLFDGSAKHSKVEKLEKSLDIIRAKFGQDSVLRAVTMENKANLKEE